MTRRTWPVERKVDLVLQGMSGERPVAELCRTAGISRACYYHWRQEFMDAGRAGLARPQIATCSLEERIRQLEAENAPLHKSLRVFQELSVVD